MPNSPKLTASEVKEVSIPQYYKDHIGRSYIKGAAMPEDIGQYLQQLSPQESALVMAGYNACLIKVYAFTIDLEQQIEQQAKSSLTPVPHAIPVPNAASEEEDEAWDEMIARENLVDNQL